MIEIIQDGDRRIAKMTREQLEVIESQQCYIGEMREVDRHKIHDFVYLPQSFYDESNARLVFFGASFKDQKKFLYYTGNENNAQLLAHWNDVTVWEDVNIREGWLTDGYVDPPDFDDSPTVEVIRKGM